MFFALQIDIHLDEEVDSPGVVHSRREDNQQIVQKHGLVVQVELDGLVVQLDIGHFGNDVLRKKVCY